METSAVAKAKRGRSECLTPRDNKVKEPLGRRRDGDVQGPEACRGDLGDVDPAAWSPAKLKEAARRLGVSRACYRERASRRGRMHKNIRNEEVDTRYGDVSERRDLYRYVFSTTDRWRMASTGFLPYRLARDGRVDANVNPHDEHGNRLGDAGPEQRAASSQAVGGEDEEAEASHGFDLEVS